MPSRTRLIAVWLAEANVEGRGLTQDDHCTDCERDKIHQQVGWLGSGGYGQQVQQEEAECSVHSGVTQRIQLAGPAKTFRRDEEDEPDRQVQLCTYQCEGGSEAGWSETTGESHQIRNLAPLDGTIVPTVCDNTKKYPAVVRDFAIVSDIGWVEILDCIPEGTNGDSVIGDDGP